MSEASEIRSGVLDFLALAAGTATAEGGGDRIMGRVAYVFCKHWLELFEPGLRYIDGLKGDRDRAAAETFRSAFSEEEYAYLERFGRFVELRVEMTPRHLLARGEIHLDRWAGIARDARNTLELIAPGHTVRRHRIEDILRLEDRDSP